MNKKEEMLKNGEIARDQFLKMICEGHVLRDEVVDNERIIVTLTEQGYGYQVLEAETNKPIYYAVGKNYISNLQKNTDLRGYALRYEGGKSRIQRNLEGVFVEYIAEPQFRALYVSFNGEPNAELSMYQRMAGYNPQDAVTLFGFRFDAKQVWVPADAQLLTGEEVSDVLRVGVANLDNDGNIDYEQVYNGLEYANNYAEIPGINGPNTKLSEKELKELFENSVKLCQSTFLPYFQTFGVPVIEGIQYNGLLSKTDSNLPLIEKSQVEGLESGVKK